jgi:mannose-6-phosphate isomerase class I
MWDYTSLGDERAKYERSKIVITHLPLDTKYKIGVGHPISPVRYENGKTSDNNEANCKLFKVDRYEVADPVILDTEKSFVSVVCVEGEGRIGNEIMKKGDSFFLPEKMGKVEVSGSCEIIVTTV